ncbi:MAG: HEPN domain-containing protein [Bacteroidetes bacterium]|nr:MAG: HEPN domain-containing protein [Bacteroidota bacterium]
MRKMFAFELLMKKANADLRTSKKLLYDVDPDFDIICFHLQQFIEKYLKAFLIYNNIEPKKVHSIEILLNDCASLDSSFQKYYESDFLALTDCSVLIRYDELEDVDRKFLEGALVVIEELKRFIESKIKITEGLF